MNPSKASKIMATYAKNNYNAYKTLMELGYSKSTALNDAKATIDRASRTVNESLQLDTVEPKEVAKTSYEILGLSKEEVIENLKEIATQSRDYTNRLKVVTPMARDIGIKLDDTEENKSPTVNLTVESVKLPDSNTPHAEDSPM